MIAVLISIRPKWCEKIINGQKTIEVRKTRPKMDTPFKCYIYCTKPEEKLLTIMKDGDENYGETYHGKPVFIKTEKAPTTGLWDKRQKVIGEFLCDEISNITFGWHISNLRIYDTPRELREFYAVPNEVEVALKAKPRPITRPPQSWRYVEEELWND